MKHQYKKEEEKRRRKLKRRGGRIGKAETGKKEE
jgi:hypothetical protein